MMNFPNFPNLGDIFQPVGGPAYAWDGEKWVMAGSPITWTPAYDQRNRIVNGAMQVSQENGTTLVTGPLVYPADEWISMWVGPAFSAQKVATPQNWRLRYICTTAKGSLAATDFAAFVQRVEGIRVQDICWGTANAKQLVLRFGWKSPAGTYSISVNRADNNRSFVAPFTISAAQAGTDTLQTIIIPGDTLAGTWGSQAAKAFSLFWNIAAGSTYAGGVAGWQNGDKYGVGTPTNGGATLSNTFELWDVGLYLDPAGSGIPPAWEMPDEAQELTACQRYYQQIGGLSAYDMIGVGTAVGANQGYMLTYFQVQMRSSPTVSFSGSWATWGTNGANVVITPTSSLMSPRTHIVYWTSAGGSVAGGAVIGYANNDPTARYKINARM